MTLKIEVLIFSLIFTLSSVISQENKKLVIDYSLQFDTPASQVKNSYKLITNGKKSVCELIRSVQLHESLNSTNSYTKKLHVLKTYKDHTNDYMVSEDISSETLFGKPIYIKEKLKLFQWNLTGKTKEVLKYKCQEAKTSFRGREYTVYFTNSLPFKAAPWKFNGLPGVVLEVWSDDGFVKMKAEKLAIKEDKEILNPFKNKNTLNWEEFTLQYTQKAKNRDDKLAAAAANLGAASGAIVFGFREYRLEIVSEKFNGKKELEKMSEMINNH